MRKAIGLLLALVGGILLAQGISRKDSLAGSAAEVGKKFANKVDGGARIPEHYVYIGGGAVLILAGAGLVLGKST
jgi:Protein of unknown function (DUF3185)